MKIEKPFLVKGFSMNDTMMLNKLIIALACLLIGAHQLFAQQEQQVRKNTVALSVGRTNYSNGSFNTIGYGADYLRRLSPRWELGVQMDFNIERHEFKLDAVAFVPVVAFNVWKNAQIFTGVGLEHSIVKEHSVVMYRLGGEYPVFLNAKRKRNLILIPGIFLDYFGGQLKPSMMVGMGYMF